VVTKFFANFCKRYSSTISLNKNLLISGTVGFIVSLVVVEVNFFLTASLQHNQCLKLLDKVCLIPNL
jgi:hypothetical protein